MMCGVCLDLAWDRFHSNGEESEARRLLTAPYLDLLASARTGCQTCDLLCRAISVYSRPMILDDPEFVNILHLSTIGIWLRNGYTTTVQVLDGTDDLLEPYFEIELYTQPGIPSPWEAFGPSARVPPELDISTCMDFLSTQLQSCEMAHQNCLPPISKLPTRVIDVGSGENLRLIEGRGQRHRYIALSHCWGGGKGIIKTTNFTLKGRLQQFKFSSLPRSFRDAIQITRMLKIEYLWIDSLCIIQEDDQDWNNESKKMADVYSQSYLTIAATGSSNSLKGCLFSRVHETKHEIKIPLSASARLERHARLPAGVKVRYANSSHRELSGDITQVMKNAPLLARAWAFQERILSPRILHFHGEEMLWECQESSLCECGYKEWEQRKGLTEEDFFHNSVKRPFTELRLGQGTGTPAHTQKTWLSLVEEFTKLNLSFESDRLPAISGLASCVSQRLEGPYMAGIWSDDLASGLMWNKFPYQHSRRVLYRENDYVPTWSWASVELLSRRPAGLHYFHDGLLADSNFRLISSTSCWRKNSTFSSLRDTSLHITGSVISCNLIHRHQPELHIYPTHLLEFQDGKEYVYVDITCDQETADQTGGSMQVECLLIARTSTESHIRFSVTESGPCIIQFALILQKLDTGAYERIGTSQIDSRKGWFTKARQERFEIV